MLFFLILFLENYTKKSKIKWHDSVEQATMDTVFNQCALCHKDDQT